MVSFLLLLIPLKPFAQQSKQVKVSEINVSNINSIEERTFLIHTILEKGYFCYAVPNQESTIEIYVASDAPDELSDFDFFYNDLLYEQLNEFSHLDKNMRGELYAQWRQEIDDDVNRAIYASFMKNAGRSDNATCETAAPFCTDQGAYLFPAGVNSGSPCGSTTTASCNEPYSCSNTPGQSYNCLSTAPNPAFYYLKIAEPGDLNIFMQSTPLVDIDFDCWGPFDNMETACDELACSNIVDCSYSISATEYCHINGAQTGEFYILLITNYSNAPCNITFENRGTGTTDCGILPPMVENDGPFCTGETIHLSAHGQSGASYSWDGPNGFTSTEQNPIINNATVEMSGSYTCTITIGGQSSSNPTEVVVNAMPDPNPSAQPCVYGSTTTLNVDPGAEGTFTYHWEPEDMVANPDSQSTETVMLTAPQEYTVTVTNTAGDCTASTDFTVTIAGSNLTADVTVDASELCEGESTTLHAIPHNGTGRNHFNWSGPDGFTSTQQNVQVTPAVGTTRYTCIIDDELTFIPLSVDVTVHPNKENPLDPVICEGTTYEFHGHTYTSPGHYTDSWTGQTKFGCDSVVNLDLTINPNYPDEQETISDQCNRIIWHGMEFTQNGDYRFDTISSHGCDSIVTLHVRNMEYTPTLDDIQPNGDEPYPHWVIPATEFQINTYHFKVKDLNPNCTWENVKWTCEGAPNWIVKREDENNPHPERESWVSVTVIDRVEETVWLTAHVTNRCTTDTIIAKYFLVCSFYDTDEQDASAIGFNVVPNPNNGEMTLTIDNLTGEVNIKVYGMNGNLIDNFDTQNEFGHNSITYCMKQRSAGIYYFVATAKEGTITKKVVVTE